MVINLDTYRKTRRVGMSIPFGERVAIARKNQGKTQIQLGGDVNYSQSIVSRQEAGKLPIDPSDAVAYAVALNNKSLLEHYCSECPVAKAFNQMFKSQPNMTA